MAVKTITIDMEAYELLFRSKVAGESFSDVIKRRIRPKPDLETLLFTLRKSPISESALKDIESMSKRMRRERLRTR